MKDQCVSFFESQDMGDEAAAQLLIWLAWLPLGEQGMDRRLLLDSGALGVLLRHYKKGGFENDEERQNFAMAIFFLVADSLEVPCEDLIEGGSESVLSWGLIALQEMLLTVSADDVDEQEANTIRIGNMQVGCNIDAL